MQTVNRSGLNRKLAREICRLVFCRMRFAAGILRPGNDAEWCDAPSIAILGLTVSEDVDDLYILRLILLGNGAWRATMGLSTILEYRNCCPEYSVYSRMYYSILYYAYYYRCNGFAMCGVFCSICLYYIHACIVMEEFSISRKQVGHVGPEKPSHNDHPEEEMRQFERISL